MPIQLQKLFARETQRGGKTLRWLAMCCSQADTREYHQPVRGQSGARAASVASRRTPRQMETLTSGFSSTTFPPFSRGQHDAIHSSPNSIATNSSRWSEPCSVRSYRAGESSDRSAHAIWTGDVFMGQGYGSPHATDKLRKIWAAGCRTENGSTSMPWSHRSQKPSGPK